MENTGLLGQIEQHIKRLETAPLSTANKQLILKYDAERRAKGIKPQIRIQFFQLIRLIAESCKKDFVEMTKDDVIAIVNYLQELRKIKRRRLGLIKVKTHEKVIELKVKHYRQRRRADVKDPYYYIEFDAGDGKGNQTIEGNIISRERILLEEKTDAPRFGPQSITSYTSQFKVFWRWLHDGENEKSISWIKRKENINPDWANRILSKEDIKSMINAARNPQDKALVAVLYETGARAAEFLAMNAQDLKTDELGGVIHLRVSKTKTRPLRLIFSMPYLKEHLNNHPLDWKNNADAPLWVSKKRREQGFGRGEYIWLLKKVHLIGQRAGLKQRVHPHLYRHSLATALSPELKESLMNLQFGWSEKSDMARRYSHVTTIDLDDKLAAVYGVQTNKHLKKKDILVPKICEKCQTQNPPTSSFCSKCGEILDLQTALRMDEQRAMEQKATNKMLMELIANQEKAMQKIRELEGKQLFTNQ